MFCPVQQKTMCVTSQMLSVSFSSSCVLFCNSLQSSTATVMADLPQLMDKLLLHTTGSFAMTRFGEFGELL